MTVIGPLLNATPTSPTLIDAHVTESFGLIVIAQPVLVAPRASVTWTEKLPAAVGVPVMAPSKDSASIPPATCRQSSTYKARCRP